MTEEWRQCLALSRYEVSNLGRVRIKKTGYVLKPYKCNRGYLRVTMRSQRNVDDELSGIAIPRGLGILVLQTFSQTIPVKSVVRYRDGDKTNCRLDNLYWGTWRDIILDNWKKGYMVTKYKFPCGPLNPKYIDGRWKEKMK